jgi:tRNA-splicing ligase RtcB
MPEGALDELPVVKREYKSARKQVGTLGGGNHFIEVQKGSDGYIWLMVHSGSRNIGKQVADHYNNIARSINRSRGASAIPDSWQLPSLHLDSREGTTYLSEMEYCLSFARASRNAMMTVVQSIFLDHLPGARFREIIDVAHNYASRERHYDRDCIVHRKGATRAFADETGIIPGSQGASSYIVRGLGNPESFCSSSHGAGRVMGRKEAVRRLDLEKERGLLEKKGIVHSLHSNRDLDEAGSAYKDIDRVMELQKDLVEIKVKLEPLGVVKG